MPIQGNNKIRRAPDIMVVLGRPKGYGGSYKQWEEHHIAATVVFEIISPGNTVQEMAEKFQFLGQVETRGSPIFLTTKKVGEP